MFLNYPFCMNIIGPQFCLFGIATSHAPHSWENSFVFEFPLGCRGVGVGFFATNRWAVFPPVPWGHFLPDIFHFMFLPVSPLPPKQVCVAVTFSFWFCSCFRLLRVGLNFPSCQTCLPPKQQREGRDFVLRLLLRRLRSGELAGGGQMPLSEQPHSALFPEVVLRPVSVSTHPGGVPEDAPCPQTVPLFKVTT